MTRGGILYADSSALLKLAFGEDEAQPLETSLAGRSIASSRLVRVECGRALRKETRRPALLTLEQLLGAAFLVDVSAEVIDRAIELSPVLLRSLDAVHVATALSLNVPDLEFVTYDDRMAAAARAHGLTVVQPGR